MTEACGMEDGPALEARLLRATLAVLMEYFGPCDVTVFGSRARRDHRPDSDLDLVATPHDDRLARPNVHLLDGIDARVAADAGTDPRLNVQLVPAGILEEAAFEWPFMKGVVRDGIPAAEHLAALDAEAAAA